MNAQNSASLKLGDMKVLAVEECSQAHAGTCPQNQAQGRQARDWLTGAHCLHCPSLQSLTVDQMSCVVGLVCAALLCLQRSHTVCPCPTAAWRRRGCPDSNGGPKSPYMSFHAVPQSPDNRLAGFLAWMRQSARVQGWAPLHCAAQAEKTDVVDMLLSHGADAQAADAEGWTPLHCATKDRPAAFMLLGFGADANAMSVHISHTVLPPHSDLSHLFQRDLCLWIMLLLPTMRQ
ncbi:TPA: hypothetical protein ACH3X1_004806 [Trebouxia sp. C0004]